MILTTQWCTFYAYNGTLTIELWSGESVDGIRYGAVSVPLSSLRQILTFMVMMQMET